MTSNAARSEDSHSLTLLKPRILFCITLAIILIPLVSTQAEVTVETDTESSLQLTFTGFNGEGFNSPFWDVNVEIIEPPPIIADAPFGFSVSVTHLGTPDGESGPSPTLNVNGAFGGFPVYPDPRFPFGGEPLYVHDQDFVTHDNIDGVPHIDTATLYGTQVMSGGSPMQAFILNVEHTSVPEPSTLALAALGALGVLVAARRKKRTN